jgi:hypothetical protein
MSARLVYFIARRRNEIRQHMLKSLVGPPWTAYCAFSFSVPREALTDTPDPNVALCVACAAAFRACTPGATR